MPRFSYKAKKGPREVVEGFIDAESESQALMKINALGLFPISMRAEGEGAFSRRIGSSGFSIGTFFKRIKASDLAIFTRQLADLLDAGLTIINGLDVLSRQTENKSLKRVITDLRDYIKSGNSFATALKQYPSVFPNLYTSMVRSGEASGTLEHVLNRLADFLEEQEEFKTKVQSALAYPVLMASVGLITIIVLLTYVMPRVVGIFEDLGQQLPFVTLLLLGISSFLRNYWYCIVVAVLFLFFAIKKTGATKEGKSFFDRLKNSLPLLGPLMKKADIARFARTLGTLLHNGVTLLESLEITRDVVSSELAKADLEKTYTKVRDGTSLTKAMTEGRYFPFFVTNMIAVGEESGQVERNLFKIADSYERELDKMMKIVASLIEPAMILIMGGIVGFIVISILLPIFQISLIAR